LKYNGRRNFRAQVFLDDQPIGDEVAMPEWALATRLAYLTAAVHLAKKEPMLLTQYLVEYWRDGSKELSQTSPVYSVDLMLSAEVLTDIHRAFDLVPQPSVTEIADASKSAVDDDEPLRFYSRPGLYPTEARWRSSLLKERYDDYRNVRQRESRSDMTINIHRKNVLNLVEQNAYSIIVGATGSGKTTQVPQIVLEAAIEKGEGAEVDIICVQPRRIAASSVARRVAFERGERLQDTVGYHVRFDAKLPQPGGSITFCTTGVLLKQLQYHPDLILDSVSHIILDEVHERDIHIDFLMVTLKTLLETRKRSNKKIPKVVLMSATMNTSLFADYFGQLDENGTKQPCSSINVPGRMYPVKEIYLEDIMPKLQRTGGRENPLNDSITKRYLTAETQFSVSSTSETCSDEDVQSQPIIGTNDLVVPVNLVATIIAHIAKTTSDGAILAFLPGLGEIMEVERLLRIESPLGVNFGDRFRFEIFKLHSSLRDDESQDGVFRPLPEGCRKIILSTNIAETSVTIPDVQHVVDSGTLREKWYSQESHITQLRCTWISKSSSKQRAGRAGRVRNGYYYALFSKARFDSFDTTSTPEMLRSDLQEICLDVKVQSPNSRITEFLAGAMEPPLPQVVQTSVQTLKELEALTLEEDLTPLGRLLASLPVQSSLGKMIVLGVIFRCLDPLLILCAAAENNLFLRPIGHGKEADAKRDSFGEGHNSDAINLIEAFRQVRQMQPNSFQEFSRVMQDELFMNARTFLTTLQTIDRIEEVLVEAGLIPYTSPENRHELQYGPPSLNENSNNLGLVKALTIAGFRGNIALRTGHRKYKTRKEDAVSLHWSSTNHIRSGGRKGDLDTLAANALPQSAILSYSEMFQQEKQFLIGETNLVTPLMVALFGPELEGTSNTLTVESWLKLQVKLDSGLPSSRGIILQLRKSLDLMLSKAFDDLSNRNFSADDPHRVAFTTAVANIIKKDEEAIRSAREAEEAARAIKRAARSVESAMENDGVVRKHYSGSSDLTPDDLDHAVHDSSSRLSSSSSFGSL
jgi:ATP-dependent RNA helicase DHX36